VHSGRLGIVTLAVVVFSILRMFLAHDEATRLGYIGLLAESLFALPPGLESLRFLQSKIRDCTPLDKKAGSVFPDTRNHSRIRADIRRSKTRPVPGMVT
jgi:hypothetical protein